MRWTLEELDAWRGHEVLDGDAERVGEVVATFVDEDSRAPRWLAVRTGAHGDDVSPVPFDGAEPTGAAIRVPHPVAMVVAAPHVASAADLTADQDRELCSFYGLEAPPPPRPHPVGGAPGVDDAVVAALRDAYALERQAHARLQSLIKALDDEELKHDVARHLTETEGHAAAIAGRLEQLEEAPSSVREMLGVAEAVATPPGETADLLRAALEFERRECATYVDLTGTARDAGDDATAAIAEKIRADEEAMAETIAAALRRMGEPSQGA
jgi:ferritin-like metal-binding protein YciE